MTIAAARDPVQRCLEDGVHDGVFPGVAAVVSKRGLVVFQGSAGWLDGPTGPPASPEAVYDLASLTKPLVTAACLFRLVGAGRLAFDQPVVEYLPEFAGDDARRGRVTLDDLLRHRSGLPAWRPYFAGLEPEATVHSRALVLARALEEPLQGNPGGKAVYSDVGYILLGRVLERATQLGLSALAEREVFSVLGLGDCGFADLVAGGWAPAPERTAPTGLCLWRRTIVRGVVQDENAFAMGGVAGHAGLFGSVEVVVRVAEACLDAWLGDRSWIDPAVIRAAWTPPPEGETWVGGWDTPSPTLSSAGDFISSRAVGHLAFTGPSLWIDLEREMIVAVVCNRVHPDRHNTSIRRWRPAFHNTVFSVIGE